MHITLMPPKAAFLRNFCMVIVMACVAFASGLAQAQERFARVFQIKGVVTATGSANAVVRTLQRGDAVFAGERIQASSAGEAVLQTEDAGVIAVRPNAVFVVEQYVAKGTAADTVSVRILQGALRIVTGWVGLRKKDSVQVRTPTATVGIRGTDHEPYVLTAQMSVDMDQPEGTYNRVFSGGTLLQTAVGSVFVDPGKVGFAPVVEGSRQRALLTALMPALLDRTPQFFLPGAFDDQIEALARQSMEDAMRSGRVPRQETPSGVPTAPQPNVPGASSTPVDRVASTLAPSDGCDANALAAQWLAELDAAVAARDSDAFLRKFSAAAVVTARVQTNNGATAQLAFNREQLAQTTIRAMSGLEQFASRRPVVRARASEQCSKLQVESLTIESGVRNGSSYRLESVEKYDLENQNGIWIAVRALTEQR